jgi:hypothetical protein
MDGNDKLGQLLEDVISNTGAQQQLSAALGIDAEGKEGKKENTNE